MKKCLLVLIAVIIILSGCVSFSQKCPESGIWYCEELDIYLNMGNSKGVYLDDNGEYAPLFVQIDHGTGFYINFCEDQESEDYFSGKRITADYMYNDGVLQITDRQTDVVYEFVEVAKEQYPGG